MNFPPRAGRVSGRATPSLPHAPRAKLQRTNPGSSPLSLRGILFKRSGPALYSHLSEDERDQIGVLRAAGRSMGTIARALGRAKATISRELQRNALPLGGYSPLHAAGAYQLRRRREAILEREAALRLFV